MNQIAGTIILTSTSGFSKAKTFASKYILLKWVPCFEPHETDFSSKQTNPQGKKNPTTKKNTTHPAWLSYFVLLTSLTQGRLNWQKWTEILIFQHSCQSHSIGIDSSLFHVSCWCGMGVQERIKVFGDYLRYDPSFSGTAKGEVILINENADWKFPCQDLHW